MNPGRLIKILTFSVLLFTSDIFGQDPLSGNISLDVKQQRLDHVLEILSNTGNFYFSYNSNIVKRDSLITLKFQNKTIAQALSLIFNKSYEFQESGNYVIIRKAPIRLTVITKKAVTEEKIYSVSGFVFDEQSGFAINDASVYEKKMLASSLTNQEGYFKLRLKSSKATTAELTISKQFYEDNTVIIEPRHSQELTITLSPIETGSSIVISPEDYLVPDTLTRVDSIITISHSKHDDTLKIERSGIGKFLVSTKQKIQSLNLKKFFTTRPFQVSFIPGFSTQGKMSSQVVNNFSLNVLGGYTAGTNGVELGGLFNINKNSVRYLQAAGLFNAVGGKVTGVQLAGLNNTVLDNTIGLQAAGVNNIVRGTFSGLQLAGVYNHVTDSLWGVQLSGVGNFTRKKIKGVQMAGVINFSNKETHGLQVAGVINYSKRLRGVQIGLINIADSSDGYSIGLINIVLKGYHKLSISSNEVLQLNAAFKTGNSKLYSILLAGMNLQQNAKAYSFGYGIGSEIRLNRRNTLSLNPELMSQYVYLGSWDYTNILNRFQLSFHVRLGKYLSVFGGPSYSVFISDQLNGISEYKYPLPGNGYNSHSFSNKVSGWIGWNFGIHIF